MYSGQYTWQKVIRKDENLEKERRSGEFFLTQFVVTVDFERGQIPAVQETVQTYQKRQSWSQDVGILINQQKRHGKRGEKWSDCLGHRKFTNRCTEWSPVLVLCFTQGFSKTLSSRGSGHSTRQAGILSVHLSFDFDFCSVISRAALGGPWPTPPQHTFPTGHVENRWKVRKLMNWANDSLIGRIKAAQTGKTIRRIHSSSDV